MHTADGPTVASALRQLQVPGLPDEVVSEAVMGFLVDEMETGSQAVARPQGAACDIGAYEAP